MKKLLFLIITLSLTCVINAQNSNPNHNRITYNTHKTILQSKAFTFTSDWIYENQKRKEVSELNTFTLKNNTIRFDMRNFEGSEIFKANKTYNITDYKLTDNTEKLHLKITFKINAATINLHVPESGVSFAIITTENGKEIQYIGKINAI